MKQAMYDGPRMEQELSDAEIARKLQEEELLVSREDALVNLKELRQPAMTTLICKSLDMRVTIRPKVLLLCILLITFVFHTHEYGVTATFQLVKPHFLK